MSGTMTAVLTWVDQNDNPITDPPPPAEVYVLQWASASWTYGGEEIAASVSDQGVSTSLGGTPQSADGPPNWSRWVWARKLSMVDGSSGTISLPVNVDAHLSFTCTAGFQGATTAQVNYEAVEVAPADCYDFNGYPNPPPSESTPCAQDAATKLAGPLADGTGYYTQGRAYTNRTAHHALTQLKKTAIFYVFGHGGNWIFEPLQTFWNGTTWTFMVEKETGQKKLNQVYGIPEANVVVLELLPANELKRVLLAVFEGCHTGYRNYTYGSVLEGVVAKGADCALGFTGTISDPGAHTWADRFWDNVKNGDTAYSAWSKAASGLLAYGMHAKKFEGNQSVTVHPARYGN